MRILLDHHAVGHLDRADGGDPAEVVATEVDQHDVFGAFLLVRQQVFGQRTVFVRRGAALAGAGDRPHGHLVAFETGQDFRAGADDVRVAEVEEIHVGRRIQRAQRAIDRHRRRRQRLAHALRRHDLHDVAVEDVALGGVDRRTVGVVAEAGHRGHRHAARRVRFAQRRLQPRRQRFEPQMRVHQRVRLRRVGIDDEGEPAGQVVEHRQFVGQQQVDVRHAERIGLVPAGFEPVLDIAHHVVAEVADQPAGEARQARQIGHPVAVDEVLHEAERVGRLAVLDLDLVTQHADVVATHDDARLRRQAENGVAAPALAALHRFEQIGVRRVGQLEIGGQRRVEVGQRLARDRNAVVAGAYERLELIVIHGQTGKRELNGRRGVTACAGPEADSGGSPQVPVQGRGRAAAGGYLLGSQAVHWVSVRCGSIGSVTGRKHDAVEQVGQRR